jgi:hypothetical protein
VYRNCFVCGSGFRQNAVVPHCSLGQRLAFEPATGRLWVVCHRCGQWCLVPLEHRWEAIQECERRFREASTRVSSANVGLAKVSADLTLIRVGAALRDELANWRYGPRFLRRRRRRAVAYGTVITATGTLFTAAAVAAASPPVAAWLALAVVPYGWWLLQVPAWRRVGELAIGEKRRTLRRWDLASISIRPLHGRTRFAVVVHTGDASATLQGRKAARFLAGILPRVNWDGGSDLDVRAATREIDTAEAVLVAVPAGKDRPMVWERVTDSLGADSISFAHLSIVPRLALEMAVAEEMEREIMAAEAAELTTIATSESEIAQIADEMFLPTEISKQISEWRRRQVR